MIYLIIEIIAIACFAIMFSTTSGIDWKIKPFKCHKCMAWWIGLLFHIMDFNLLFCILFGAVTHIISIVIYNLLTKTV